MGPSVPPPNSVAWCQMMTVTKKTQSKHFVANIFAVVYISSDDSVQVCICNCWHRATPTYNLIAKVRGSSYAPRHVFATSQVACNATPCWMTCGALGQASSLQEPRAIAALSSRATLGWWAGKNGSSWISEEWANQWKTRLLLFTSRMRALQQEEHDGSPVFQRA